MFQYHGLESAQRLRTYCWSGESALPGVQVLTLARAATPRLPLKAGRTALAIDDMVYDVMCI